LAKYSLDLAKQSFITNIDDQQEAAELSVFAGNAFRPRSPISTREFFAGRWEQMITVADAVSQTGLHIIIFGERGVGKTSLANIIEPMLQVMEENLVKESLPPRLVVKVNVHQGDSFSSAWNRVFEEISMVKDRPVIGINAVPENNRVTLKSALNISNEPSIDVVRRTTSALKRSVFIFDEFDRGGTNLRVAFTDLIKALSDYAVDCTIVIVGVADTVDHLIKDHASILRSVVQVQLPRMNERELEEILEKGCKVLGVKFHPRASKLVVKMSQGLPHYTHLIGLHSTRSAVDRLSRLVEIEDVHKSFRKAVQQAVQNIQQKYLTATHSAHKDALYEKVILACAAASSTAQDALGYFHPADVVAPLCEILGRPNASIATFQKHINEFCKNERGSVLERSGTSRAYKYRFSDPLLPPFIFMKAVAESHIDIAQLTELTS
jgi:Holliday junction resolvasome RuvABC ATP-dependent DNA helicase subunit